VQNSEYFSHAPQGKSQRCCCRSFGEGLISCTQSVCSWSDHFIAPIKIKRQLKINLQLPSVSAIFKMQTSSFPLCYENQKSDLIAMINSIKIDIIEIVILTKKR
jgi:hypothetical protein